MYLEDKRAQLHIGQDFSHDPQTLSVGYHGVIFTSNIEILKASVESYRAIQWILRVSFLSSLTHTLIELPVPAQCHSGLITPVNPVNVVPLNLFDFIHGYIPCKRDL